MNTNINVKKFREVRGLTQRSMADLCGVTTRTVQNWESGGVVPEIVQKYIRFMTDGDETHSHSAPLIQINDSTNSGNNNSIYSNVGGAQHQSSDGALVKLEERPLVPAEITRKPNLDVYEYVKTEDIKQKYPAFSFFPNVELYCRVLDDSMQPRYYVGDILALATFDHNRGTLVNGRPFIIDTNSVGFIFSLVYDKGEYYECRPMNKEGFIETTMVQKSDVIRLYRVVGMMRLVG